MKLAYLTHRLYEIAAYCTYCTALDFQLGTLLTLLLPVVKYFTFRKLEFQSFLWCIKTYTQIRLIVSMSTIGHILINIYFLLVLFKNVLEPRMCSLTLFTFQSQVTPASVELLPPPPYLPCPSQVQNINGLLIDLCT
jgi:hypothetical protein